MWFIDVQSKQDYVYDATRAKLAHITLFLPGLRPQLLVVALLARALPVEFSPKIIIEGVEKAVSQHTIKLN